MFEMTPPHAQQMHHLRYTGVTSLIRCRWRRKATCMLPIVTEDLLNVLKAQLEASPDDWKRSMLNKLREENPEINTLLLEVAQTMNLGDPKSIILGGFLVYSALELAERAEEL